MKHILFVALGLLIGHGASAANEPSPLKPGAGVDATIKYCSICHTTDYIVMNSTFLTSDGWKAEVAKMRTAFGAPINDAISAEITAYLAAHYAVTKMP